MRTNVSEELAAAFFMAITLFFLEEEIFEG
jgi:hypothetical protein